jgi:5'-nucleotidase
MAQKPDIVVSGINHGPNLGDDVIYSGTVAAATEGRHLGLPAIAISMAGHKDWQFATAARVLVDIVAKIADMPLTGTTILNVNVPNVAYEDVKGWQFCRLGNRHQAENMVTDKDPFGRRIYWYGRLGPEQDAGPGTDFYAINNNYVAITPISVDMTDYQAQQSLASWHQQQKRGA